MDSAESLSSRRLDLIMIMIMVMGSSRPLWAVQAAIPFVSMVLIDTGRCSSRRSTQSAKEPGRPLPYTSSYIYYILCDDHECHDQALDEVVNWQYRHIGHAHIGVGA